jgi:hypothetical protein
MNAKYKNKISLLLLGVMLFSVMFTPLSGAQGIILDGVLSEEEWILWFIDEGEPGYTVYYATDETNVYIGLVFEDDDTSNDHLQLAYQADDIDYKIKIKHDTIICYRASGGTNEGWWSKTIWGLPPGVTIAIGTTGEKTSYEICIDKNTLGKHAIDFPKNFKVWIMYISENPDGGVNYYPNVYAGWWWVVNQDSGDEEEKVPEFHIPETPIGTMLSLAAMAGAFLLFAKRDKPLRI